jgi:hypothetical protein
MNVWAAIAIVILAMWTSVLLAFAAPLRARWREPVFRHPLLVIESDDWGAGPLEQAEALRAITGVLRAFRDGTGRHPVMTLGIVFEIPDSERIEREDLAQYHGRCLDDACFDEVNSAIREGIDAGVFAPQLHGQCHYWPQAVMAVARTDPSVRRWLTASRFPQTEALPSALQSRWIDASLLPSRPLDAGDIAKAASDEALIYRRHFGMAPQVAVATTFVWNEEVEKAWKDAGVEVLITPGRRATCRDATGGLDGIDRAMLTGELSDAGQSYLVRDVYFEPTLGHAPERLLEGLEARTREGRACLVEMHRFNFLQEMDQSLNALRTALERSLGRHPNLRFTSPQEIARDIRQRNGEIVQTALGARIRAWLARAREIPRFHRATRITGLAIPLNLVERAL